MSNLKLPNMSRESLAEITPKSGEWKKIGYETYARYVEFDAWEKFYRIEVRHHQTIIATLRKSTVEINNGGYATPTTNNRINRILQDNGTGVCVGMIDHQLHKHSYERTGNGNGHYLDGERISEPFSGNGLFYRTFATHNSSKPFATHEVMA